MDYKEEKFRLERGGKQCDPISPQVFICLLEHTFRKVNLCNHTNLNCIVIKLNKLRFADYIYLFASYDGEIQEMVNEPTKLSTDVGLRIDTKNTKAITNRATREIKLEGEYLEYVPEYISIRQLVSFHDNSEKEVKRSTGMAWDKFKSQGLTPAIKYQKPERKTSWRPE